MIKILSVILIVLGTLLVIATIKEGYDKTDIDKSNKSQYFINLITGSYHLIIGLLVVLKVISEKRFINLMIIFVGLRILIDNKKDGFF